LAGKKPFLSQTIVSSRLEMVFRSLLLASSGLEEVFCSPTIA